METKYSHNGFWLTRENNTVTIGLSEKGQDDLGQIAFVELLKQESYTTDDALISVEAAKAVTELFSPVSGDVIKWHEDLENIPERLNDSESLHRWIVTFKNVPEEEWESLLEIMPLCDTQA